MQNSFCYIDNKFIESVLIRCYYCPMSEPIAKYEVFEYKENEPYLIMNLFHGEEEPDKILNHWHDELEIAYYFGGNVKK